MSQIEPVRIDSVSKQDWQFRNLLVVIGGSAGGFAAISKIVELLPENFQATLVVATHRDPKQQHNQLAEILSLRANLSVQQPVEGQQLVCTTIYVGHPSESVQVEGQSASLDVVETITDRMSRIDDLFHSAARVAGPNAVGVILSGMLSDGVSGLQAISEVGGRCIVQSPSDAQFPDMPRNALAAVGVDFVGTAEEIAAHLIQIASDRDCQNAEQDAADGTSR